MSVTIKLRPCQDPRRDGAHSACGYAARTLELQRQRPDRGLAGFKRDQWQRGAAPMAPLRTARARACFSPMKGPKHEAEALGGGAKGARRSEMLDEAAVQ
jgi:hypothetical protein